MRRANLSGAEFIDSTLAHVNLTGALGFETVVFRLVALVGATWVDGRICGPNSYEQCD
ncbi:pentapeptide repeat-containing protein [Marivita geojedonensis]|uniref:pentapeptide repeat-containing protein n=1 Tax=Marivita geojedonensis TaxID=1123756 RepID=UPI00117F48C0